MKLSTDNAGNFIDSTSDILDKFSFGESIFGGYKVVYAGTGEDDAESFDYCFKNYVCCCYSFDDFDD